MGRAKYTRAREISSAPLASRLLEVSRARVCVFPALSKPLPDPGEQDVSSFLNKLMLCSNVQCNFYFILLLFFKHCKALST